MSNAETGRNELEDMTIFPAPGENVTLRECKAMRLLYADGWSVGELSMTFMVDDASVRLHAEGHCQHVAREMGLLADGGNHPAVGEPVVYYRPASRGSALHADRTCASLQNATTPIRVVRYDDVYPGDKFCGHCCDGGDE